MQNESLDLLLLELVEALLAKDAQLMLFASGVLRGKLVKLDFHEKARPAPTFGLPDEPCPVVQVAYIPAPRNPGKVTDPAKFKFTRNAVLFNIPVGLVDRALQLKKFSDGVWILNMNSRAR